MASNKKILGRLAEGLYLIYDKKQAVLHGTYRNYTFLVEPNGFYSRVQNVVLTFCVGNNHHAPMPIMWKNMNIGMPKGSRITSDKFLIKAYIPIKGGVDKNVQVIRKTMDGLITYFETHEYKNCDQLGEEGETCVYKLSDGYAFLNYNSADVVKSALSKEQVIDSAKMENFGLGIIGALVGGIAASFIIFLIARLGYVSTYGSIIMGVAIVYGYKFKGNKLSKLSAALCVILAVALTYLVFRLDLAVSIYSAVNGKVNVTFGYCFSHAKSIMDSADKLGVYNENFFKMMFMGVVGACVMVYIELSDKKTKYNVEKL